jgi:hypothetical protein
MSDTFAICFALLSFGSMWACWKLGYERGQNDTIKEFSDYCDQQDAKRKSTQSRRDNRQK